ncbi:hypothetical protein L226DRAFT_569192 [Lentinus tigrinus ALCF2SS1-7]|uniref:uncharacterized protein n=1 Tax=Lentinus tigrinus ALCF2SS1-7 TaxID=1328758 RepID=UPI0011662BDE|nr:hypothetical protein L226DRAFT_569192 [Lentinus tigrinus ALCF2SS1-7]
MWPGWQPQAFAALQSVPFVPRWTTSGQYQAVGQQAAQDATFNPFAASLAQRLLQPTPESRHDDLEPVQLSRDDERILVQALKAGLAEGLTPRQIVERLQATNNDTGIGWKDVFLDNVERLLPQIFPSSTYGPIPYPFAPQMQGSSSISSSPVQFESPRHRAQHRVQGPVPSSRRRNGGKRRTRLSSDRFVPPSTASTSSSQLGSPPKRRGSLLEYHDNTFIPPRNASSRPEAPDDVHSGYHARFTDDDKIFFIHFLRWRLREGEVPDKRALYRELAMETPNHDAAAWRKHWDSAPWLPDRIYIEARKRADNEADSLALSDGEETGTDWLSTDGPPTPAQASSRPAKERLNRRVTEEDIHKMAKFLVEKRHLLHAKSKNELWREFSRRPENKIRRTQSGWVGAARSYESQIQQYVDQIMGSHPDSADEARTRPAENHSSGRASGSRNARHENFDVRVEGRSMGFPHNLRVAEDMESTPDQDEEHVKVEMIDLTD